MRAELRSLTSHGLCLEREPISMTPATKPTAAPALDTRQIEIQIAELATLRKKMLKEFSKVVVGQQDVLDELLITIFAGGHNLLEGVPGLAKTLMINTLAK